MRRTKKGEYLEAVELFYRVKCMLQMYLDIEELVQRLQHQVRQLSDEYFRRYVQVTEELIATFEDNKFYFNYGRPNGLKHIIDINTVLPQLEQIVENDERLVEDFCEMMQSNQEAWQLHDANEQKISKMIISTRMSMILMVL